MFKRMSTLTIPPPERMEQRSASKSGGKVKNTLATLSQLRVALPTRTPLVRGQSKAIAPKNPMPGPSRKLYPSSPVTQDPSSATHDASVLDGIAVLPPTNSDKKHILRSASKKAQKRLSTSASNIPRLPGAKHTGVASKNKSRLIRQTTEMEPLRKTKAKKKEPSTSPSTLDSTAVFEADELAMSSSTPGARLSGDVNSSPTTSRECRCNVTKAEGSRKLYETLARENREALSTVLNEQKKLMCEFKELIQQQKTFYTENTLVLQEQRNLVKVQTELMSEIKKLLRPQSPRRLTESDDINMSSGEQEKENTPQPVKLEDSAEAPSNSTTVLQQYNDIRTVFNSLSLRTPMTRKNNATRMVIPMTPKSIMSRALQQQLSDLFADALMEEK